MPLGGMGGNSRFLGDAVCAERGTHVSNSKPGTGLAVLSPISSKSGTASSPCTLCADLELLRVSAVAMTKANIVSHKPSFT